MYFPPLKKYIKIFRTWFYSLNIVFPNLCECGFYIKWDDLIITCCHSSTSSLVSEVIISDQVYQPLKSAKEHLQHKLAEIYSIVFILVFESGIYSEPTDKNSGHLSPWVQKVWISSSETLHWSITTVEASHDALQKHVKPSVMAVTDVWCSCTEGERAICFGHEINLPCGTGAERSESRHNKSNVTREP